MKITKPTGSKWKVFIINNYGRIERVKSLTTGANNVFKVAAGGKRLVVKIYLNKGYHEDNELSLRRLLGRTKYFRNILSDQGKEGYVVFEFSRGKTLFSINQRSVWGSYHIDKISEKIRGYFLLLSKKTYKKCGFLGKKKSPDCNSWFDFLLKYQTNTVIQLEKYSFMTDRLSKLYNAVLRNHDVLCKKSNFCLIPIDLNFKNILICRSSNDIKILSGATMSGDFLYGLGQWFGHVYKTPLEGSFIKSFNLSPNDKQILHLYALISNLNVLSFVSKFTKIEIKKARPWGNKRTFLELIDLHLQYLKPQQPKSKRQH